MINNKKYLILLLISIMSVGILSVAFAALSSTLNITSGRVTQNALTWDVGFVAGTYTGTPSGTSSTGRSCGNVTATRNTLTVANTTLSKPGDSCRYVISISNNGSLEAYLEDVIYTAPTSMSCTVKNPGDPNTIYGDMTCGNIYYSISLGSECSSIDSLHHYGASGNSKSFTLYVSYVGDSLNSSSVTQGNAKISFIYTDDSSKAVDIGDVSC